MSPDAPPRCPRCGARLSAVDGGRLCAACLFEQAATDPPWTPTGAADDTDGGFHAGDRLGPYEVVGSIGAGGMGRVYHARDHRIGRDVAIKVLPEDVAQDPDRVRRFEQEARAAGRLNHPNILVVHDVGRVPNDLPGADSPYLVTELVDGRTLRDALSPGPLEPADALALCRQLAAGLAAAHERGIIHRDLKPENVAITTDQRVKLLDFGLAKMTDANAPDRRTSLTDTGVVMGTAAYMSPEQVRGWPADKRSDVFAFGAVMFEMLTGQAPFRRSTAADTVSAILNDAPPEMCLASGRRVPIALERVARRCLEKDPDGRFSSAVELASSLAEVSDLSSPSGSAAVARLRSPARARLVAAVLLIAGLAGLVWSVARRNVSTVNNAGLATITPFLTTEAIERQPVWSPAGNLIAYTSNAAGNADIWISDVSGTHPMNLTADWPQGDSLPTWSPDGRELAFVSNRDGLAVYTMSALGGPVRKRVAMRSISSVQWLADGSLVISGRLDETSRPQIYRSRLDDSTSACLTCDIDGVSGLNGGSLSRSGRLLLFKSAESGGTAQMFVRRLSSGEVHVISQFGDQPRWAGDDEILFASMAQGRGELFSVRIDPTTGATKSAPVQITSGLSATSFSPSPDGRQIVVHRQVWIGNLWSFPTAAARIQSLSQGLQLTSGEVSDGGGRWTHDGNEVIFGSNRRGAHGVWSVSAAGGSPTLVLGGNEDYLWPSPSPNGRWITVDRTVPEYPGNGFSHLVKRDGSGLHPLGETWFGKYRSLIMADWAPGADRLAVAIEDGTEQYLGVVQIDAAGRPSGDPQRLPVRGFRHRWSPDGRLIVLENSDGSAGTGLNLWIVDPARATRHQLTDLPGAESNADWRVGPPLRLYFLRNYEEIWFVPMREDGSAAGPPQPWFQVPGVHLDHESLDINPRGDRLVTTVQRNVDDLWLVQR